MQVHLSDLCMAIDAYHHLDFLPMGLRVFDAFFSSGCMKEFGNGFDCVIFALLLISWRKLQLSPLAHCPLDSHCQQSPRILAPFLVQTTHCSHVCQGCCLQCVCCMVRRGWTQIEVPAGWTQIIRGPSSVSAMAQRTPRCFEAQSVSRFEDSGAQAADGPSEVEDHEVRGCIEGVGARAIRSPCLSGRSSQAALKRCLLRKRMRKLFGSKVLWQFWSQTMSQNGELSRTRWRRSVHELQSLQWGNSDECEKYCERAAKRFEKAKESVGEASPSRSCRPTSSLANNPRDRRVVAFTESRWPVGGRFEGVPPVGHGEDFSRDQFERANRPSHARGCSIEGSCASLCFQNRIWCPIWSRRQTRNVFAWPQVEVDHVHHEDLVQVSTFPSTGAGASEWARPAIQVLQSCSARDGRGGSVPLSTNRFEISSCRWSLPSFWPLWGSRTNHGPASDPHSASVVRRSSQGFGAPGGRRPGRLSLCRRICQRLPFVMPLEGVDCHAMGTLRDSDSDDTVSAGWQRLIGWTNEVFKPRRQWWSRFPNSCVVFFALHCEQHFKKQCWAGMLGMRDKHVAGSCSFCCFGCFSRKPHIGGTIGRDKLAMSCCTISVRVWS